MKSLLVINAAMEVSLSIALCLCASTRSQLKKLLKFISKRARNNEIQFVINKCEKLSSTRRKKFPDLSIVITQPFIFQVKSYLKRITIVTIVIIITNKNY